MSASYSALPNPRSEADLNQELDDAFDDEQSEHEESGPIWSERSNQYRASSSAPGAYDFEREYDVPPPGSPPTASALALPNDYGNSNGLLPSGPVAGPVSPQPSFLRRAVGAILPTHYVRVPSNSSRPRGGGTENDGVFANVQAKPSQSSLAPPLTRDGDVHMVLEDAQKEAPPSYSVAQADAVPSYWDTTVHAPVSHLDSSSDMLIDDLPSGSFAMFLANLLVSFFFQFIGFVLTYVLHLSHAAKYGSRAGLGLTLIQLGFYWRSTPINDGQGNPDTIWEITSTSADGTATAAVTQTTSPTQVSTARLTTRDGLSFFLMTLGWFILLVSSISFWRIKHWESSIRASSAQPRTVTAEDVERDISILRNIERAFGLAPSSDEGPANGLVSERDRNGEIIVTDDALSHEARLAHNLREAGLI